MMAIGFGVLVLLALLVVGVTVAVFSSMRGSKPVTWLLGGLLLLVLTAGIAVLLKKPSALELEIVGPPGTAEFVQATASMLHLDIGYRRTHHDDLDWDPPVEVTEMTEGVVVDEGGVRIVAGPTDHNILSGELFANENMGPESLVTLERGDNGRVTARIFTDDEIKVGTSVHLAFDARHVTLFDDSGARIPAADEH